MAQNEQTTEEHSMLEQQSPGRLDHPALCVVWTVWWRGIVVSGVCRMNEVNARRARSTWMGDRLRAGIPSRYVTSQLGQLSLASLRGRLIEYSFGWDKGRNVTSAGWQITLCDPMWHVSSRSAVAALQTAIHLLIACYL